MVERMTRRDFLRLSAITAIGEIAAACGVKLPETSTPPPSEPVEKSLPTEKSIEVKKSIIPETIEEWQKKVQEYDQKISEKFGPPRVSFPEGKPLTDICQFLPLLSDEQKKELSDESGQLSPAITSSFVLPQINVGDFSIDKETGVFQFEKEAVKVEILLLRLPEKEDLTQMGEMGSFLSQLTKDELFSLGLILNLVNLRAGVGTESLKIESPSLTIREIWGFRVIAVNMDNPQELKVSKRFNNLDTTARLYIAWPYLKEFDPLLWEKLCKNCIPFFFRLMTDLKISAEEVFQEYQKGHLISLLKRVGQGLYEKGAVAVDENGKPINDVELEKVILGLSTLVCADNPNEECVQDFLGFFENKPLAYPSLARINSTKILRGSL